MPPRTPTVSSPVASAAVDEGMERRHDASEQSAHPVLDAMFKDIPDLERLAPCLFTGSSLAKLLLIPALEGVDLSRVPPTPGLPGAPRVLLAQALAAATDGDARLARDTLDVLRELDPQREIVSAWRGRVFTSARQSLSDDDFATPPQSPSAHESWGAAADWEDAATRGAEGPSAAARQAAWRVAMALADTPSGMDVLQAVLDLPVDQTHRRDFALLLKAAAAMPPDFAAQATPMDILESDAALQTLPGEAIACAAARMAGDVDAARVHQWALTAVRNDLFDAGPGSHFCAINARLMKMGRWIERATSGRKRWLRNPLVGKSPFRALRHGVQGVERAPAIARHRLARENALREAATALKDRLIEVANTARSPGRNRVPEALLRAAVLEHCLQTPAPQSLERKGFAEDARSDIAKRVARMLQPSAGTSSGTSQATADLAMRLVQQPDLVKLAKARFDAKILAAWFLEARKAGGGTGTLHHGVTEQADWAEAVAKGLTRAEEEAVGRDTRVPKVTRETVRTALKDIIANIEGSSRLRLSSGGISGIGLRQITASISAIASACFARGRVDARLQRGRQAVFEIAMPPYDMEMVLGTQRQIAGQVGGGAFVGPDLWCVGKAGVNVDTVLYGIDKADVRGISLRLPRVGRPVPELREEFSRLVDRVLDGSEGGEQAADEQPLLKRLLEEFPELTVNRIGAAGDGRRRHSLGADIAASASSWMLKANASIGAFVEAQRDVTKHYRDASGRMRVERSIIGNTARAGVGVRASIGPTLTVAQTTGSAGRNDVSLGAVAAGASAERILSGAFDRREEVYEDGRLHPLSFVETECNDVDEFLGRLQPRLDQWLAAGVDRKRLREKLDEMKQHTMPTHSFAARFIMKPEQRARDDVYRSALRLCELHPSGMPEAAKTLALAIEGQWKDPASMQPYSLRAYDRRLMQQTQGVELLMQLASVDAAEASHIDNRLDVPAR
ncbi:MAG TPA: hypothetical protein VFP68_01815 [Burkholderiaceae bacterium]|nr:hypothetical protein [Burkholderiaceae bacterium]